MLRLYLKSFFFWYLLKISAFIAIADDERHQTERRRIFPEQRFHSKIRQTGIQHRGLSNYIFQRISLFEKKIAVNANLN